MKTKKKTKKAIKPSTLRKKKAKKTKKPGPTRTERERMRREAEKAKSERRAIAAMPFAGKQVAVTEAERNLRLATESLIDNLILAYERKDYLLGALAVPDQYTAVGRLFVRIADVAAKRRAVAFRKEQLYA